MSLLQVCGVWRAVPRLSLRLLRAEQLYVALVTPTQPSGEVWGPLIRHRALAAGEGSQQLLDVKLRVFLAPEMEWAEGALSDGLSWYFLPQRPSVPS